VTVKASASTADPLFPMRKRRAGEALVAACEQILGAEGPCALARVNAPLQSVVVQAPFGPVGRLPPLGGAGAGPPPRAGPGFPAPPPAAPPAGLALAP
jgi:hypothetical protein